jgi:hypothetical protein
VGKLSAHFTEYELTRSAAAERAGLPNGLGPKEFDLYAMLCGEVLEPVRSRVGKPVRINSGYRSPEVNRLVKGSKTSAHMALISKNAPDGEAAADIEVWGYSNYDLARLIDHADTVTYDQVILEHHYVDDDDPNSGWVHVSVRPGAMRRQKLTAYFHPVLRKTVYAPGLHKLKRGQVVEDGKVVWPNA